MRPQAAQRVPSFHAPHPPACALRDTRPRRTRRPGRPRRGRSPGCGAHGSRQQHPAAKASLAEVPESVTLTFSDPMDQKYAKVAVTGPDKQPAAQGLPRVDGKRVTIALDPQAPAGAYSVGYRVVSADGHPVSGSYSFIVQAPKASAGARVSSPEPPAGRTASPTPASAGPVAADGGDATGTSTAAVTAAGVLMAAGAGGYLLFRRRRVSRGD
nr:copper resistance protein CopC [Streptomyces sp. SID14515]